LLFLNVFIPKYNSQNTLYQVFDKINLPCRVIRGALRNVPAGILTVPPPAAEHLSIAAWMNLVFIVWPFPFAP